MSSATRISKRYVETRRGEVHVRLIEPEEDRKRPLLCLHPAPSSGLYFETVLPMLNAHRKVICPDYPGYGGSVRLAEPPSIGDYATSMADMLDGMDVGGAVDVFGFHTGCLVAVEMALNAPEKIGKLVLCDVPYFTAEQRPGLKEKVACPLPVTSELASIESAWNFNIASRIDDVPLDRALDLLAEHLRSGSRDYFAFDAAFSYDCETQFAKLRVATDVIATQSGLLEPSRMAAQSVSGARLIEALDITSPVFEANATAIAKIILRSLDEENE